MLHRSLTAVGLVALLTLPSPAFAYIGPGAGFAFAGSMMVLLTTFALAFVTVVTWPITFVWRQVRVGDPYKNAQVKRVVVLGLDGMDPGLAMRFIQEGRLPNLKAMAERGVFRPLDTSHPSMSPVAWSTFSTGVDASRHGIYDFLTVDPCTYAPMLSSTDIGNASRVANIGPYVIPLSKPRIKLLQRSQAFWKLLGEKHIPSIIQRVPITFPPVPFNGLLLSGMCVPDLRGSQGTFSFFSTETDGDAAVYTGGEQTVLRRNPRAPNVIRSRIVGPDNSMLRAGGRMTLPFTLTVADDKQTAVLVIDGCEPVTLTPRRYSEWVTLSFKAMPGVSVSGIARFYLNSLEPHVNLYMTPIHIDPENPAMPISHPSVYSIYLAKKLGPFATLGLAEDTWALNERVIDEAAFYEQAMLICDERERMFVDALEHTPKGLVTSVFDTTDRVSHMFYRYLDPSHPANVGRDATEHVDAIAKVYEHMDAMIGRLRPLLDRPDTLFMVISDHGFTNFRRGVNLNTWLKERGYLVLKDGHETSGEWFEHLDWSRTQAFSLGLTGLFINRQGRERSGVVPEGAAYRELVHKLARELELLLDPATGGRAVRKVEIAPEFFDGPYRFDAPDLLVGYEGGYRNSWECATGAVTADVFTDNTKSWSGDHCVDPAIVPGVFFCNRQIVTEQPKLIDLPFSILRMLGQAPPRYMQGKMVFGAPDAPDAPAAVSGLLDPASLSQSGSAPGALMHPTETRP